MSETRAGVGVELGVAVARLIDDVGQLARLIWFS